MLLDEVDLILHPLKSELNWPIGEKEPIDFAKCKLGVGLRWDVQWHLLDAIFYAILSITENLWFESTGKRMKKETEQL